MLSHAALELELTQGVEGAIQIGLNPFPNAPEWNRSMIDVIRADLANSGRFRVNVGSRTIEQWKQKDFETVLIAKAGKTFFGGQQVTFQLIDPFKNTHLMSQTFKVKTGFERKLAHHVADIIFKKMTGDKGVFSTKLAYIVTERKNNGLINYRLEVADSDGFNAKTVMESTQPIMSPTWAHDGKSLAFVSFEKRRSSIYRLYLNSGKRELITQFPGINGAPAWSHDDRKLAVVLSKSGSPKVYVLDVATKKLKQMTYGFSIDTEPDWSPDNRHIVFTSDRGGSPQVYQLDVASRKIKRVSFIGNYNARPRYSPDGKSIVMVNRRDGMFNIALQDLERDEVRLLSYTGRAESPTLSPNGRLILYASSFGNRGILNLVSTDGRVKLRLPARRGDVQEPAWSPYLG